MNTNAQLATLLLALETAHTASEAAIAAAFDGGQKNVDHQDILPVLQTVIDNNQLVVAAQRAFLANEFSITPTFVDNEDGTGTLTLQVKDGNADNVTAAVEIEIGFSATAGAIYADLGTVVATTGTVTRIHLADAFLRVRSNTSGVIVLTLTTADEWFTRALVVGASQANALSSSYVVTGP